MSTQVNVPMNTQSDPVWTDVLHKSLFEVFDMMLGIHVSPGDGLPAPHEITAMVGYAGSLCGLLSIHCSVDAARRFACKMLGIESIENENDMNDALGEICNMVAGNFKAKVPGVDDATCMLSVPTTVIGSDYEVHACTGKPKIDMVAKCDEHVIQVLLHVQAGDSNHS